MDKLDVGQPISSLSWSPNYNMIVVSTEKGSILLADSTKLQGDKTALISEHSSSSVIGIDVLGNGFEFCVVSAIKISFI